MSEDAPQLLTSEDIFSAQFPATKFRDGYDQNQIDDYLDEVVRVLSYYEALNASPEAEVDLAYITVRGRDVREVDFDYTRMRVGYDQDAVDDYLDQVAATLEAYEKLYGIPPSDQRYQVLQVDGAALEAEAAEQAAASGELPSNPEPAGEETVTPIDLSSEAQFEAPAVENAPETADSAPSVPSTDEPETATESEVRSSVLGTPTGSIPAVQPVSFEQAVFTDYEDSSPHNGDFGGDGSPVSPSFPPLNSPVSPVSQTPETDSSPVEGGTDQTFASEALPGVETPSEPVAEPGIEAAAADATVGLSDEWGEVPQYPVDAQLPEDTDSTAAQPYAEAGYDAYQPYGYDAYSQPMTVNPADIQGNAEQYPGYPAEAGYASPYGMETPEGYGYAPQAEGENQSFIPEDTTMVMPVTHAAPMDAQSPDETPSEYVQGYEQAGYPQGYEDSPAEAAPDYDSTFDADLEKSYELEDSLGDDYPDEINLDDAPELPVETTDAQADSVALQEDFYAPVAPEEAPASPDLAEPAGYYSPESVPESMPQPYEDFPQPPYAFPESPAAAPLTYGMPEQPAADSWQTPNPYQPEGLAPNDWGGTPASLPAEPPAVPPADQPATPDFSAHEPVPDFSAPSPETPIEPATEQPQPMSEASATPAESAEPSLSTFQMPKLETVELGQTEPAPAEVNDLGGATTVYGIPGDESQKAPLTDVVAPPLPTPGVGMDLGQIREKLEHEQAVSPAEPEPTLADLPSVLMTPTRSNADFPPPETPTPATPSEPAQPDTASEHLSATRLEELAAQNTASVPDTTPDTPMVDTQSADGEAAKGQPAPIFPEDSNPRPMLQGEEPLAEVDPDGRFIPHFLAGYRSNLDTFTSVYGALDESGSRVKPASIAKLEAQQHRKSITTGYLVTVATSRPLGADDQVFVCLPDGREVPVTSASSDFDGVHLTIPKI